MTRGAKSRDRAPSSPPDERMLALATRMTAGATFTSVAGSATPDSSPPGKSAASSSKAH